MNIACSKIMPKLDPLRGFISGKASGSVGGNCKRWWVWRTEGLPGKIHSKGRESVDKPDLITKS